MPRTQSSAQSTAYPFAPTLRSSGDAGEGNELCVHADRPNEAIVDVDSTAATSFDVGNRIFFPKKSPKLEPTERPWDQTHLRVACHLEGAYHHEMANLSDTEIASTWRMVGATRDNAVRRQTEDRINAANFVKRGVDGGLGLFI